MKPNGVLIVLGSAIPRKAPWSVLCRSIDRNAYDRLLVRPGGGIA
jgi:hypothetical protein